MDRYIVDKRPEVVVRHEMPWIDSSLDHRRHAMQMLGSGLSVSEVSRLAGVSRQCLYKWQVRFDERGDAGLVDVSRAPRRHAHAVSAAMERLVVKLRRKHDEGPRKIRHYLLGMHLAEKVPAASTIGLILKRHDLVADAPRRRRAPVLSASFLTEPEHSHQVLTVDYKGEFDVDGHSCYPLTVQDRFSRFVLATRAHSGTGSQETNRALWRVFRKYGLPEVIRCDNGTPFVSTRSPAGLSSVSIQWIRLGIRVERTRPATPSDNGRHERFHKSLKHHTAKPPAASWPAQQQRFDRYRHHYNDQRPHEALGMQTPASIYQPGRPCPHTLPEVTHLEAQTICRVFSDGGAYFRGFRFYLGLPLAGQTVGIVESADDIYTLRYGQVYLGFINKRGATPRWHQAP